MNVYFRAKKVTRNINYANNWKIFSISMTIETLIRHNSRWRYPVVYIHMKLTVSYTTNFNIDRPQYITK